MGRWRRFAWTVAPLLLVPPLLARALGSAEVAGPIPGACYAGVFPKQRMIYPRDAWVQSADAGYYSEFQLVPSPDGRTVSGDSWAKFDWSEGRGRGAGYPGWFIDLFRGSHRGRIDPHGRFSGASRNSLITADTDSDYTEFKGQFLSHGHVLFRFRSHFSWSGRDYRTGWVSGRGWLNNKHCQDTPENGP